MRGSYSASVTVLWVFAARVNITEYVAQARPCPCCGTVTEGSYATCAGAGQLRPETFGQAANLTAGDQISVRRAALLLRQFPGIAVWTGWMAGIRGKTVAVGWRPAGSWSGPGSR